MKGNSNSHLLKSVYDYHSQKLLKIIIIIASFITYFIILWQLFPFYYTSLTVLFILPVILISVFYGLRIGAISGILSFPTNYFFLFLFYSNYASRLFTVGGFLGYLMIILISIVIGNYADLKRSLQFVSISQNKLLDNLDIEIAVYNLDGDIVYLNTKYRERLKRNRIKLYLLDYSTPNQRDSFITFPVRQKVKETIEKGAIIEHQGVLFTEGKKPTYCLRRFCPQFDSNDKPNAVYEYGFDITNQKTAELTLLNQERELSELHSELKSQFATTRDQYSQLLNESPLGIAILKNDQIIFTNPEFLRMYGYSKYEAPHNPNINKFIIKKQSGMTYTATTESDLPRNIEIFEAVGKRRDGLEFPVLVHSSSTYYNNEEAELMFQSDISDLKEYQKELKVVNTSLMNRNQDLENILYFASHDFRLPVRKINNFLQIIHESTKTELGSETENYFSQVFKSVERLHDMIDSIFNYAKYDIIGKTQIMDLHELIEDIINFDLKEMIYNKGGTINIKSHLPKIRGDSTQFIQLFINLISNSLKFVTPDVKPLVTISCNYTSDTFELEVEDNGVGIDDPTGKVFNLFHREPNLTDSKGYGIGLAICKKIIANHNGTIGYENLPTGGTKFWMIFPISKVVR